MTDEYDLKTLAKALSFDQRKRMVAALAEAQLRPHLKSLLQQMEPASIVELTHGPEELGKDLVTVMETRFGRDVKAIVVKTGVVGGKTMGKVDEISSQVEQSFLHPAQLKTVADPLHVNEVLVMVAGEFTTKGQQRLKAKTKNMNVRLLDLNWLVQQFTDYYPQVFFEGQVVDFLKEKIVELEQIRFVPRCTKALSESWVEPLVSTLESPIFLDDQAFTIIFQERRLPFSQLKQLALPGENRIILAGDPGTGKTTALAKLALDMLKDSFNRVIQNKFKDDDTIPIPLLVAARDIINVDDCGALLSKYVPQDEIRHRFEVKSLFVDGLDEIPSNLRSKAIDRATQFSQEFGCSIIVASRKVETIKNPFAQYSKFELLPFDFGRALNFFKKLVSDGKLLSVLTDGLEKIRFQIIMTPLSLTLLVDIAENYKEIPASVTELYDRFTDIALGRFDKEKGIEVLFEYEIKKRFLAELAFVGFLERDRLEMPKSEFDEFVASYGQLYMMDDSRLQMFILEIERSGMLTLGQVITFCHRSFLDYFAAYSVFLRQQEIDDLDRLLAHLYFTDGWGEVTFFYVGLKREISTATIATILSFNKEGLVSDIDKFLVGRLLQAGWHSLSETKVSAIEQSLPFAPVIRQALLEAATKQAVDFPEIFGDFLVLALCDLGLASGFLQREEMSLFARLSGQPDVKSLYSSLLLLWATRRFMPPDEIRLAINQLLDDMSQATSLTSSEQARMLLICTAIETQDKTTTGAIKRNLHRLRSRNPELFRNLLPHTRKGFRPKAK